MQRFEYSAEGLALTKRFEGRVLTAYQDAVGVWTIAYGHTGPDVYPGRVVTEFEADAMLKCDLSHAIVCVNRLLPDALPVTQGQFDALVDFAFNLGCAALTGSTLLRLFLRGETQAADEFGKWIHAGGKVLPGLVERRAAEREMFLRAA